ncbi:acetyltransferas-like protein [Westerdykella ornata]|uniref:Acetyltransferas-like protein n=1 Tax=Westerdykella ornata TaxID=318751 RepID=A0A6A6J5B5_WESOR|nr:acetyltransferas-like protein [Westerdykella ornata]KAF2271333.1 acetyltransferas-like protein [Westerdykella ornata]
MYGIFTPPELPQGFRIQNLVSLDPKNRQNVVDRVRKIERKAFPSSEAFDFDAELKKKNTSMLVVTRPDELTEVVGYLVFLRMRKVALLHKICVVEHMRRKGIGRCLIHSVLLQLEKGGCHSIQLWVDEARSPARELYQSYGFREIDRCVDYYGPGRTGLKMQLSIEK